MPPRPSTGSSDGQTSSKGGSEPSSKHEAQLAEQLQGSVVESTEAPAQTVAAPSSSAADSGGVSVEDYLLPRTLTQRLAKGVLPPNTQIQRDAVLAITKAATVFVSYLSSHANEITMKKTLSPEDVLSAISELEFENFLPRLQRELAVHAEAAAGKRKAQRQRVKARESGGAGPGAEGGTGNKNEEGDGEERDTKRLKRDEDNTTVISDGGSRSGKEGQKKGSKITVEVPGGQTQSEGKDDGEDDEEEEEQEEEEGDEVEEEEGDDSEESSEEEEEEEDDEEGREGDATDASHGHLLQPDIDSELESASDKEGDPDEMDSQTS